MDIQARGTPDRHQYLSMSHIYPIYVPYASGEALEDSQAQATPETPSTPGHGGHIRAAPQIGQGGVRTITYVR